MDKSSATYQKVAKFDEREYQNSIGNQEGDELDMGPILVAMAGKAGVALDWLKSVNEEDDDDEVYGYSEDPQVSEDERHVDHEEVTDVKIEELGDN